MIERLKAMLRRHEGLRLKPYQCPTGHWSIGYAHNLDAHGEPIPDGILEEQAEHYLDMDVKAAIRDCCKIVGFSDLNPVRQAVLIDMCFNMGIGALMEFRKMLLAIWCQQWGLAATELLDSKYALQVGDRSKELGQMLLTGNWQEVKKEGVSG